MSYEVVQTPASPELRQVLLEADHAQALELDSLAPEMRETLIALLVEMDREASRALLGL